jgi:hypothetical protein
LLAICYSNEVCSNHLLLVNVYLTIRSSLLTLYRHALLKEPIDKDPSTSPAKLVIRSVIRMVLGGTSYGLPRTPEHVENIPIWALNSCYLAALSHVQYGDRSDRDQWVKELDDLKSFMGKFAQKWKLAGKSYIIYFMCSC